MYSLYSPKPVSMSVTADARSITKVFFKGKNAKMKSHTIAIKPNKQAFPYRILWSLINERYT